MYFDIKASGLTNSNYSNMEAERFNFQVCVPFVCRKAVQTLWAHRTCPTGRPLGSGIFKDSFALIHAHRVLFARGRLKGGCWDSGVSTICFGTQDRFDKMVKARCLLHRAHTDRY